MHTADQQLTGGKPAEQHQRAGRLLDGGLHHLHTCLQHLYMGSSTLRDKYQAVLRIHDILGVDPDSRIHVSD
jgi:hypothetical protein